MVRAPAASVAPTEIDPSAPVFDTAAASSGVETPAIGAWMIGKATPIRFKILVIIYAHSADHSLTPTWLSPAFVQYSHLPVYQVSAFQKVPRHIFNKALNSLQETRLEDYNY
jgi:hypothetical protein